ncbi:DedA family protein [Paenibacillus pasadenensis]|uniref:Alkaline phosphatase n=1 Tax=Paenibacillus pasadenensis TaxID=217090 RepID=A0A2N5ND16_9BACL|nr:MULTISPECIES: DedA family protein [Paenibacillus]PLT48198.1 Alkaline phosphatase [Paenibacillus pasadenensis]QGG58293.1 DedA family protein [Paenibacillus sp. B01]
MEAWITEIMDRFGYFGVGFLIAIENLFPPIPSEVILTFGGFMTARTSMTVVGVIIAATLGSVIGAVILYYIGAWLNAERLERIVARWGHILRLKPEDVRKADAWFDRYGPWAVLLCRLVPLVRSLISIPAGMSGMSFPLFLLLTTIGSLIWNTVLVSVGASVGESWETIVGYMDIYSNIAYALIALGVLAGAFWFYRSRRKAGR